MSWGESGDRQDREAFRARRREECGGAHTDLSSPQIVPIFARVTGIPESGFTEVRSGWWVRAASADIFHFLRNSRGFDYRFRWGVSLAWVPRVSRGKLKWHRTLKSAEFDLWDQAYDYLIRSNTPWREADVYYPDRLLGEACFEEDLAACWARVREPIASWWAAVSTPIGVLERAEEQGGRKWEEAGHSPDPELVAGFTVARLGRVVEGMTRAQRAPEFVEAGPELRSALEFVAQNHTS